MTIPYKLSVKIGTSEFSAEGSEGMVKEQFDLFLIALKHSATPEQPATHQAHAPHDKPPTDGVNGGSGAYLLAADKVTLDRIFSVDAHDLVSLKVLPKSGDSDGLIILLYGFMKLTQKGFVYAPTLMNAAKQSGIQIERISRVIADNSQYINSAGQKRGTKYSLNNKGQAYAVQLMEGALSG